MINQSAAGGVKSVSRMVITAVIAFLVAIMLFATTAFADMVASYNVTVLVDNEEYVITTNEKEPIEILTKANIAVLDTDKIDISAFKAGEGGVIAVDRIKTISIKYEKKVRAYQVYADTVAEASKELGLSLNSKSKLNYKLSDKITDGMVINVKSTGSTKLKVDGKVIKVPVTSGKVSDVIRVAQVKLGNDDYTSPSMKTKLKKDTVVKVNRVKYKTEVVSEVIGFDVTEQENDEYYQGIEKVISEGKEGKANITYKVKYVNGKKTAKKEIKRAVTKNPVNQVVMVGTKKTGGTADVKSNGVTTRNGYTVGQKIKGEYTHYCACGICGSGTGKTASGKMVRNGMKNPYYIACNWLPLGSVVNIDGSNYTVTDRGGSGLSKVGRVDIFTPEGHRACFKYGRGSCDLTIVRIGW